MVSEDGSFEVSNNERTHRFEVESGEQTAFLSYRHVGGSLTLDHTEVPPELEGRGIASKLTRTALEFARERGLEVVPICPYVSKYLKKHSEYLDLLSDDNRRHVLNSET
ncbi:MAG TPA: GNAT family N-acetyltransferase [Terriglobales bacterium]|nr:GNAT family N-acetyltransferase [Terriglobales bacterium]